MPFAGGRPAVGCSKAGCSLSACGWKADKLPVFEGSDIELILRKGHHKTLGARPMRAAVERFLQGSVAGRLMKAPESVGASCL